MDLDRAESEELQRTIQFADNLTWSAGSHTMKFGFDFRKLRATSPLGFIGADNYGNFDFSGAFSGSDFGDFLLGIPSSTSYAIVFQDNDGSAQHYALFAQDTFQAGRNLTLEYGLRWEYHPAYEDASGNIGNFDPSVARSGRVVYPTGKENLLAPGYLASFNACPGPNANGAPCTPVLSAEEAGLPESLRRVGYRIMPRLGFAYRPFGDDKTVVRGGVGGYNGATLGSVLLLADRHAAVGRAPVHEPRRAGTLAVPVAARADGRQRHHDHGFRHVVFRHGQRHRLEGTVCRAVEPVRSTATSAPTPACGCRTSACARRSWCGPRT